ncbi:MAG: Protein-arginine kinase [Candidatus Dichloromethanomonas elyunquensis]|nr:MAG: Protein-arginine kinase [Candidatus Dichloromethanomonas elyunquensis]
MSFRELLFKDSFWMREGGLPILLSTRVRLARNLAEQPFPHAMNEEEAAKVEKMILDALGNFTLEGERILYLPLTQLSPVEKRVLIEKHLISPAFAEFNLAKGAAVSDSHKVSVMINEEDHLRIQVLLPGSRLREAFHLADVIDDHLEGSLDLAYKDKFGYLTSCPTNVGTGLRVSVMVHLPALVVTNQVQQVLGALAPLGLAVRGLYGEGSRAFGNIFQISNQVTLGKSEEDTLTHMEAVTQQLVEHEMQAREVLKREAPLIIEDKVWRARGILENARLLTSEETFSFLSEDRLGIDMGILPDINSGFVSLLINSLHGSLQYKANRPLDGHFVNLERANFLRKVYSPSNMIN